MPQTACVISQLSVVLDHDSNFQHPIFQDLNFELRAQQFSALTGRNGQGKSLLLSVLVQPAERQIQYQGSIQWHAPCARLAQLNRLEGNTIADALGISQQYQCFQRIESGTASAEDFDQVEACWHLPQQWQQQLESAQLPTALDFPIAHLSEGQKTKLALSRLFQLKDHYLLLDEPSNHLDQAGRDWLTQQIQQHPMGCLVVSHDRALLQHAQHIYHLSPQGLQYHRGDYAGFSQRQQTELQALQQRVTQQKRELSQHKARQQQALTKAATRLQAGQKIRKSGSQAKVLLDFNKEQAQHSASGAAKQFTRQLQHAQDNLEQQQQQLDTTKAQRFELGFHRTTQHGEILRLNQFQLIGVATQPIHFALRAGEKLHIFGQNGIGKSTLLRHLQQQSQQALPSLHGSVYLAVECLYLDQNFSMLDPMQNAVENLCRLNPQQSELDYRRLLGQLRLRGDHSLRPVQQLSGGEQLKVALLAISQLSSSVGLLLLDEPENYLDIESRQLLAEAIRAFPGSVILVSHDLTFVAECGIEQRYDLLPSLSTA